MAGKSGNKPVLIADAIAGNADDVSGADSVAILDPAAATGADAGTGGSVGTGKRRGRKPGSTNAKKEAALTVNSVENILGSIHAILAAGFHVPELAMDDPDERKMLATAVTEVARHYDLGDVAPKTVAWVGLVTVAGKVYGVRYAAYRLRLAMEKQKREIV